MKQEEEDVEHRDLLANRVDLGLFECDSAEDEVFLFEPLLQKKPMGWGFCDLVKWVQVLPFHD